MVTAMPLFVLFRNTVRIKNSISLVLLLQSCTARRISDSTLMIDRPI